jgi:hypothetical protein
MNYYRRIAVSFWEDGFIYKLSSRDKLLFVYLFTNSKVSASGIYEINIDKISRETGVPVKQINAALDLFNAEGKILWDSKTQEIAVVKHLEYNSSNSPKMTTCINRQFATIKSSIIRSKMAHIISKFEQEPIPYG